MSIPVSGISSPSNQKALRYIRGDAKKKEGLLASVYRGNKKQLKDVPDGARARAGTITLPFNVGKWRDEKMGDVSGS
jgi:hypothetical protein